MKKAFSFFLLLFMIVFFGFLSSQEEALALSEEMPEDLSVSFCPKDSCFKLVNETLSLAKEEINCALYELDYINLSYSLLSKAQEGVKVNLIVDNNYLDEESLEPLKNSSIIILSDKKRGTRFNNNMHHKFCVIDGTKVLTGSTNPTENGLFKNNNNILVFNSEVLARDYNEEFEQLRSGVFGENKKQGLVTTDLILSFNNSVEYKVSLYHCPQDDCLSPVLDILKNAREEILFASFVLTQDDIEELLIIKAKEGLKVEGIIESRMINSKGSKVSELQESFSIQKDKNSNTMHHKFFVVDEKIVITGSMNPSKSGVLYNDENLLVIENEELAQKYKEEYFSLK